MIAVEIETATVATVPVLTVAPLQARACPVVLFIPGYGGQKEHGLSLGAQLAQAGLFVICFDPWLHGERAEPLRDLAADPAYGGVYPPESGLDIGVVFFRVIHQCLLDAQALLAHYGDARGSTSRAAVSPASRWAATPAT
jgi:dienelactone hydrolase